METEGTWYPDWSARREGAGCVLCGRTRIDDDEWGTRVYTGGAVDGFVWKTGRVALGNNVPHLHTHIVPRHWDDDPDPNGPLGFDHLDEPRQPSRQVEDTVRTLRTILSDGS
jgi:hypothetical protein